MEITHGAEASTGKGWGCDWVVLVLDPELVRMVLETPDRPMCNK
jgi:hypothetical protein